jgi:Ca2+/Na+ antiporter
MFVTLLILGVLCMRASFRLDGAQFLRECSLYLFAICWSFWCLRQTTVELWQSLSKQTVQ